MASRLAPVSTLSDPRRRPISGSSSSRAPPPRPDHWLTTAGSAQVMTRIKKSFEQKEEFLKRPALPYWLHAQAAQTPAIPKEFYAQPQKFARPVWPPGPATPPAAAVASPATPPTVAAAAAASVSPAPPVHLSSRSDRSFLKRNSFSIAFPDCWFVGFFVFFLLWPPGRARRRGRRRRCAPRSSKRRP